MEEVNPIKTYNLFYTPKITSHNFDKIRTSLLENKSKQKMKSQKGQIFPLNINTKIINNNFPNFINENKNESLNTNSNPNINYFSQNNNFSKKNDNQNRNTLFLPNMFYKNNNSNYYRNKSFYNKYKIKRGKTPNKINIKANNYVSVINYNGYNDIYKSKENKESVEWMLYNKRKNGFQDSNNNIDILDEIYNLKKYDEYMQMNQFLVIIYIIHIMNLKRSMIKIICYLGIIIRKGNLRKLKIKKKKIMKVINIMKMIIIE